ncbi:MAG: hypothetical protein AAB914_03955 [Patescibacteria group bacterium]
MINLLPTEYRDNIFYARKNTVLLRWVIVLIISSLGVALIVISGLLYTRYLTNAQTKENTVKLASLKAQNIDGINKELSAVSDNIKLTLQVLSKEILFSKLIKQIGSVMPAGAALDGLNIENIEGGIVLKASALDVQSATQLQLNLEDKNNGIFEKADIDTIGCKDAVDDQYPCTVTIKATFKKQNNPYLFIDPKYAPKPTTEKKQ